MTATKEEVLGRLDALATAISTNSPAARGMISETIEWIAKAVDVTTGRPIRELLFNARGQLDIKRAEGAAKNIEVAIRSARRWR